LTRSPKVSFTTHGISGPIVILLHGWCCSQKFWRPQVWALSDAFRIVAVDLAGHGVSAAPSPPLESIEAFADGVIAVADELRAKDAVLIGHSMGGAVAIEAALRLGPRCSFVLGVDTFTDASFYRRRPTSEIRARLAIFARDFEQTMVAMIESITSIDAGAVLRRWIAEEMVATDPDIALPALEALLQWDIESRWPMLRCPIETINSAALSANGEQIALDGLRVQLMRKTGHFPMLERPEQFNALVRAVLRRRGIG
jgi:pimeloyl-ACP methyl ester carboxylesterase